MNMATLAAGIVVAAILSIAGHSVFSDTRRGGCAGCRGCSGGGCDRKRPGSSNREDW